MFVNEALENGLHTETCQDDVNAERRRTSDLKEYTQRREDDGEEDLANVAVVSDKNSQHFPSR